MNKVIIASDSFKGSLSSQEIIKIFNKSIKKYFPKCKVINVPIADGGEGTVDCISSLLKGKLISVKSKDAFNRNKNSKYFLSDNKVAIIEISASSGLIDNKKDVGNASTYGTGLEIKDAIKRGAKTIVIGLGGSATNDGGVGASIPLGAKYFNNKNKDFIPTGNTLNSIKRIELGKFRKNIKGIKFIGMCDVKNPMFGPKGAAYIFGPQKGANFKEIKVLDNNLKFLNNLYIKLNKKDISKISGSGAAGAFGAGLLALFNGELKPGIETILSLINFDKLLNGCDCVFTGEGHIDSQSLNGKVIDGIRKKCLKKNVPCIAIVGGVSKDVEKLVGNKSGINALFTINREAKDYLKVVKDASFNYEKTIDNIFSLIKLSKIKF